MTDLKEFLEKLTARLLADPRVLLTTHRTPDPDGIGAMLALDFFLRGRGRDVVIVTGDPVPSKYRFLDPERRIRDSTVLSAGGFDGRTIVMVDNSEVERMGEVGNLLLMDQSNLLIIDHHDGARPDLKKNFQLPHVASTSEIVYELLEFSGLEIPLPIATALFAGIVADTGSFRYSKTRPRTFIIGSKLMEIGVKPFAVSEALFSSTPLERLYLKRDLYSSMRLTDARNLAYFQIRRSDVERMNLTLDDLDGMVNELIEPEQVMIGILFTERQPGVTRVSLRSRASVDLIPAVQRYGGGGHKNACGATIPLDLESAVREFIPIASSCIK